MAHIGLSVTLLHQFKLQCSCRFVEVDDELISVITDVEEDDLGSTTGYHNALPLEVHEFTFWCMVPVCARLTYKIILLKTIYTLRCMGLATPRWQWLAIARLSGSLFPVWGKRLGFEKERREMFHIWEIQSSAAKLGLGAVLPRDSDKALRLGGQEVLVLQRLRRGGCWWMMWKYLKILECSSGWWAGLSLKFQPHELCHGFSFSSLWFNNFKLA